VALLVSPVVSLRTYLRDDLARGRTNADLYAVIAEVNHTRRPGDQILIDRALIQAYTPGGGRVFEHLQFAAAVYGWEWRPITLPIAANDSRLRRASLLIVAEKDVGLAWGTIRLQATTDTPHASGPARVFRVLGPSAR
jgi:hypothetical protein